MGDYQLTLLTRIGKGKFYDGQLLYGVEVDNFIADKFKQSARIGYYEEPFKELSSEETTTRTTIFRQAAFGPDNKDNLDNFKIRLNGEILKFYINYPQFLPELFARLAEPELKTGPTPEGPVTGASHEPLAKSRSSSRLK